MNILKTQSAMHAQQVMSQEFASVHIVAQEVHATLERHMLVDGFDLVVDLERSEGAYIYDARTGKRFLDFFSFFASLPLGLNHPKLTTSEFKEKLAYVSINKPSSSDVYSREMAEFVETFARLAAPEYLPYYFFIEGGSAAVENALKVAFDWKVQKNYLKGYTEERGRMIAHFRHAFHGRSGYTLSLTNTDPTKTNYFPKFRWPRIHNPAIKFPLNDQNLRAVLEEEDRAITELRQAFITNADDIAGVIIEPIQGEGGDNHFRPEFFIRLRELCDEHEAMLIFDEVQTGLGLTGKMWAHEYFVRPDILCFGKKTQVCGIAVSKRVDEVKDNVFKKGSRINSTWGGNLTDMVRCQRYLEIIHEDHLVENARIVGEYLLSKLQKFEITFPDLISNARGRGLFCAIDLPTAQARDQLRLKCYDDGLIIVGSGDHSIRFRPALIVSIEEVDKAAEIINDALVEIRQGV